MSNNIVEIRHSQLFSLFPGWFVFLFFYGALGEKNNLSFPCMLSRHSWYSSVGSLTPSSGTSEDLDHQLALQEAKMAARNKIRSRFHSSSDLIHRLFVCISGKSSPSARYSRCMASFLPVLTLFCCDAGVADQLQTNYASDLRSILKTLFEVMATKCEQADNDKEKNGKATFWIYKCVTCFFFPLSSKVNCYLFNSY